MNGVKKYVPNVNASIHTLLFKQQGPNKELLFEKKKLVLKI